LRALLDVETAGFTPARRRSKLHLGSIPPKALLLVGHLLLGLAIALLIAIADAVGLGRRVPRERIAQWWQRDLLSILNVQVHQRGTPLRAPHLAVSNHVSWLDIPVIGACSQVRFVSRHDVQSWPIAGLLADACGTFYIRRGGGHSKYTVAAMTPHLAHGSIVLFPEGTTTDGRTVLPFHARLFEASLNAGAPVQPIALRYADDEDGLAVAPFIGGMTLAGHIWKVLCCRELHVEVRFFAAHVSDESTTRDGIAAQSQRCIERAVKSGPFLAPDQAMRSRATSGERYQ
jgi:1-acyl-sn-glycerol-3-phosphate acyltransferase